MFDEAMTSEDPRVIETLRSLMMIVTLTRPESNDTRYDRKGPLRRSFEDMNHMWKRFEQMEEELRQMHQRITQSERARGMWPREEAVMEKYSMAAAAQMAQSIDADVMQSIARKINTPGLNKANNAILGAVPPAGKLYK